MSSPKRSRVDSSDEREFQQFQKEISALKNQSKMVKITLQNLKLLQPWEEARGRSFSMFPGQIEQRDLALIRKLNNSLLD